MIAYIWDSVVGIGVMLLFGLMTPKGRDDVLEQLEGMNEGL